MIRRRFIAGASCPHCGALDKIVRVEDGDALWIECVACDMRKDLDAQPEAPIAPPRESGSGPVVWKPRKG